MTVEFGRASRAYREAKRLSQEQVANDAYVDPAYYCHIERGDRNSSARIVQLLAEGMEILLKDRADYFLLATGYSKEKVQTVLYSPSGIVLSGSLEEPLTFGQLLGQYMEKIPRRDRRSGNNVHLAEIIEDISASTISLWRNNNRKPSHRFVERTQRLIEVLHIPEEKQAEFLLLARGHPYEVVYEVLTAACASRGQKGDLQEGVPLSL